MPTFLLCLKANLENVEAFKLSGDNHFPLTIQNSEGDDTKEVVVTTQEEIPLSGSRGTAHFVMKWDKSSKKEAYINVVEIKGVTRDYLEADNGEFVPMIGFECRGVEPIAYRPEDGFLVESTGGKRFEDVDISEKDWCDFDEDAGVPVGVYELESEFRVHKK
ncbi:hypothetical protein BSKO_07812 [Bryopsis sp. KO-2023]|nr:hypothetical protein BSKO_07812 [Bryopsis sp. KO-2023]